MPKGRTSEMGIWAAQDPDSGEKTKAWIPVLRAQKGSSSSWHMTDSLSMVFCTILTITAKLVEHSHIIHKEDLYCPNLHSLPEYKLEDKRTTYLTHCYVVGFGNKTQFAIRRFVNQQIYSRNEYQRGKKHKKRKSKKKCKHSLEVQQ